MENLINCIDNYTKDLETKIMAIVENQTISLTDKNQLMEPIADQKKVLVYTKEALLKIKSKKYEAKCGMMNLRDENGK
jgi:hypothetical protein